MAEAMHRNKLVHRDIKPDNIMIRPDGSPLLLDLGITRHLTLKSLTSTWWSSAPLTPGYCSPEQLRNQKGLQDCRTDIFLIGIVLFQMATGKHPFDQGDPKDWDEITEAIRVGKCTDPAVASTGLSAGFCEFLRKLLRHQPYQRYRNPTKALEALEKLG